ncbi:hypothetical protein AC578_7868 [Pseudocercospora eumusae]|uniref:Uncharacterized protein n=1 Tax=Pseudocercospora eumusae TaxID=321146 RepID=A0A139HJ64_9PEZI|nr:hypothetical protein AC578_7868 [Pseudocercospora eumusae]
MAPSTVSKSSIPLLKPLSPADKVRREGLVAFLRTYKADDPERAEFIREKHKHLSFDILDDEAFNKAMEEDRRAKPLFNVPRLVAHTSKQRELQASGQPFSLRKWCKAGEDVVETDSKRGEPAHAPREGLAVPSKMPKSEPESADDPGELRDSTRKAHFKTESGSKVSPATKKASSAPRKGLAVIKKAAAPRSVLAASEKAERQEGSLSTPSEPDRKLDQAHAGGSSRPEKTSTGMEKAVVPESVQGARRGAEHKGSLMAQAKLEQEMAKLQRQRERAQARAQEKLERKNARAQMRAFPAPPKPSFKTEKAVVSNSRLDAPEKRERSEGKADAFQDTEKAMVLQPKAAQRVKAEIREIGQLFKTMTGFQEHQAARIVESLAGAKYLQGDGVGIRMDLEHPLPRRAHDALLDFVKWGVAADGKKAEALISKFKAAELASRPEATLMKRKREEDEEAPPPKKQKSEPAAKNANAPRQLPSFAHRRVETASSDRNLTRVQDTIYGRRRV